MKTVPRKGLNLEYHMEIEPAPKRLHRHKIKAIKRKEELKRQFDEYFKQEVTK